MVGNANLAKSDGDVIMIEYQNIFTQVQVRGPAEMGVDNENNMMSERIGTPGFSNLAGWLGNAQLGPVYLGWTGVISLATGLLWFNIVGLNMLGEGMDYALQEMKLGSRYRFVIPPELGFGSNPSGGVPPNTAVLFDVRMHKHVPGELEGVRFPGSGGGR